MRVNGVAPGAVLLPTDTSEEERRRIIEATPLGREGSAQDVAAAVVFLALDTNYASGEILQTLRGHEATVLELSFDTTKILSASSDGTRTTSTVPSARRTL